VLAQVRFAPVLELETRIPSIQEALRHAGFPLYEEVRTQEVLFGPGAPLQVRESLRWVFMDAERTFGVVLGTSSLVLEAARYDVFDAFVQTLERVLRTVGEAAELALATRIGLRYVNRLEALGGLELPALLRSDLLALTEESLDVDALAARFEWTARTAVGRLVVRLTEVDDDSVLPTDLQETLLDVRSPTPSVPALVLDTDHYQEQQRAFDGPELVEQMWQLHRHTDRTFRAIVSDAALQAWGAHDRDQD
jgi:uncharacterized protein (TIGR04255 family)